MFVFQIPHKKHAVLISTFSTRFLGEGTVQHGVFVCGRLSGMWFSQSLKQEKGE